jgi:hypothetical protein
MEAMLLYRPCSGCVATKTMDYGRVGTAKERWGLAALAYPREDLTT